MAKEFKVGDTVRLISGGPVMTVTGNAAVARRLVCEWFDNADAKKGVFPHDALKPAKAPA